LLVDALLTAWRCSMAVEPGAVHAPGWVAHMLLLWTAAAGTACRDEDHRMQMVQQKTRDCRAGGGGLQGTEAE